MGDYDSDFEDGPGNTPPVKRKRVRVQMKNRKKHKGSRFWEVAPSRVIFDKRFAGQDKGLGVFATRVGEFRIYFKDCIHMCKTHMGEWGC